MRTTFAAARLTALALFPLFAFANCDSDSTAPPPGDTLALGTWGGSQSGVVVSDSGAHVHIGCTFGDVIGLVELDDDGKLNVSGSYLVRAYPIAIGPSMPAQFSGQVVGNKLTLVVAVNDTIEDKISILGPITVQFGKPAEMGPCPICQTPAMRLR